MKKVPGRPLTQVNNAEYEKILTGPEAECESFLKARYDDLLKAVIDLEKVTGLVHRDPSDSKHSLTQLTSNLFNDHTSSLGNALWTGLTELSGLIDFGAMVVYKSEPWYNVRVLFAFEMEHGDISRLQRS